MIDRAENDGKSAVPRHGIELVEPDATVFARAGAQRVTGSPTARGRSGNIGPWVALAIGAALVTIVALPSTTRPSTTRPSTVSDGPVAAFVPVPGVGVTARTASNGRRVALSATPARVAQGSRVALTMSGALAAVVPTNGLVVLDAFVGGRWMSEWRIVGSADSLGPYSIETIIGSVNTSVPGRPLIDATQTMYITTDFIDPGAYRVCRTLVLRRPAATVYTCTPFIVDP